MVQQFIAVFVGNGALQTLDLFIDEFNDISRVDTDHMIVMMTIVEFENGMTTFKVVARNEPAPSISAQTSLLLLPRIIASV